MYICVYFSMSCVYPSIYMHISVSTSVDLYHLSMPVHLSIYPSIYLSTYLSREEREQDLWLTVVVWILWCFFFFFPCLDFSHWTSVTCTLEITRPSSSCVWVYGCPRGALGTEEGGSSSWWAGEGRRAT